MSNLYSPGPWHIEPGGIICDVNGNPIATVLDERDGQDPITGKLIKVDRQTRQCNERILAAAPTMYSALKSIIDLFTHDGLRSAEQEDVSEYIAKVIQNIGTVTDESCPVDRSH